MPRIELRDGYHGQCWRLDTPDLAKIGPWLGELLTCGLVNSDAACPAQVYLYPLEGEQLPPGPMGYVLSHDGRVRLVQDLATILGLEAVGGFVPARPDG